MSAGTHTHIVLAIADPGLRSALSAQLALAGKLIISAESHLDPGLSPAIRATALLVIEHCLIMSDGTDWSATLRAQNWLSTVIVIVDKDQVLFSADDNVHLACRHEAGLQILALLQSWKAPRSEDLNRSG
jgi:hypothetical protein